MMTGLEFVLIAAGACVLVAGVIIVARGRKAELAAEREAAYSLQRMAQTLEQLQRELRTSRDEPSGSTESPEQALAPIVDGPTESPGQALAPIVDGPTESPGQALVPIVDYEQPGAVSGSNYDLHRQMHQVRLMLEASTFNVTGVRHWCDVQDRALRQQLLLDEVSSHGAREIWTRAVLEQTIVTHKMLSSLDPWLTDVVTRNYDVFIQPILKQYLANVENVVSVVNHEQADVLKDWPDPSQVVLRAPRVKRHTPDFSDHRLAIDPDRQLAS